MVDILGGAIIVGFGVSLGWYIFEFVFELGKCGIHVLMKKYNEHKKAKLVAKIQAARSELNKKLVQEMMGRA